MDPLTLGLAMRDDHVHGVWMKGEERVYSDSAPMGLRNMVEALKELVEKQKEPVEQAVFAVPFERLFIRSIDIPPAPDLPLGPFAEQFASTEIPFPLEEAVFDYAVQESENSRRLLLVAGRKKEFEPYRAALESLRVPARNAVPSTLALYKAAKVPADVRHFLLVYFWKASMEVLWCSNGEPRYLRHVPMQQDRVIMGVTSRDPEILTRLSSELRISGDFIRKQAGDEARSMLARLVFADRRFDELPVLLQPDVPFTLEGRLLEESEGAVLASGACRLAQSGKPDLNLFQPKKSKGIYPTYSEDGRRKQMTFALGAVMIVLILAILKTVVAWTWVKNLETDRTALQTGENKFPDGAPAGASSQLASFLSEPDAIDVMDRLAPAVPASTSVKEITLERSEITIRGASRRAMDVYEGLNRNRFSNVRFLQDVVASEARDDRGMELFAISADNPLAAAEGSSR